jgi:hypothetical protein
MSHIADIKAGQDVTLHLNREGDGVSLTASRPGAEGSLHAVYICPLTHAQLAELGDWCHLAAERIAKGI